MIPFLNAFNSFLSIYSLLPLPVREFITAFLVICFALGILKILTTRT